MRLIDADSLKENILNSCNTTFATIDNSPTIDTEHHGKWVMDSDPDDGDCRCSNCHVCIDALHRRNHGLLKALGYQLNTFYKYCPNCGAKMDLKSSIEL